MEFNFLAILVAAFTPILVGLVWYSDKVFGKIWMQESGLIKDDMSKRNRIKILALTFIFSFLISFFMQFIVIHQNGAISAAMDIKNIDSSILQNYLNAYGNTYRTYKHGALHGFLASIFFVIPIVGINALFEKKIMEIYCYTCWLLDYNFDDYGRNNMWMGLSKQVNLCC